MKLSEIKKGNRVRVSDAYKLMTGINIPIQTIERVSGPFFWTEHIKGGRLKHLKAVIVAGQDVELEDDLSRSTAASGLTNEEND